MAILINDGSPSIMKNVNWQRLRILKAVLDQESFSEAARSLGISQPTVSRQIKTLEDEIGESLMLVTPEGVVPTEAAQKLLPDLEEMARTAARIERVKSERPSTPTVRIACGPWLASFFAKHASHIIGEPVDCHLDIASSVLFADMPRREADIAIRTQRPEKGSMRVRRLPHYHYAVYGAKALVENRPEALDERRFTEFNWAMMAEELDHFATSKWLIGKGVKNPVLRCSASINLMDAVRSGGLLAVVPCFAGDAEPSFMRVSQPFVPDAGRIWMVLPDDVNKRPHVRRVADRLVDLFERTFQRASGAK